MNCPWINSFYIGQSPFPAATRGKGCLHGLFRVSAELRSRFALGALFVEHANQKSLAVHRHYSMTESAAFMFKDRAYIVFTFSPGDVVDHYRRRGV